MSKKIQIATMILSLAFCLSTQITFRPGSKEEYLSAQFHDKNQKGNSLSESAPKKPSKKAGFLGRQRGNKRSQRASDWTPYFPYQPITGYVDVYDQKGNSMFYWLSPARENPDTAPLIIWLEGGPGGSSVSSLFIYLGPLEVKDYPFAGEKAKIRKIAWNQKAHVVFPDYPIGVGFSTNTQEHSVFTAKDVKNQMLRFYEGFLKNHPEFKGRPVYVAGESYGGHSVPYMAGALKYSNNTDINLKGIFITSGFVNGADCYNSYPEFAVLNKKYTKITESQYTEFSKLRDLCVHRLDIGPNPRYQASLVHSCDVSYYYKMLSEFAVKNPSFTPYYMPGGHEDDQTFVQFLNNYGVQEAINVRKNTYYPANFTMFYQMWNTDIFQDSSPIIGRLLDDGVKAVIVDDELDFICNYQQAEASISQMKWSGKQGWAKAERRPCEYGLCKEYKNLKEIRVPGAGHGISWYKPQVGLDIINQLIFGDSD